MHVSVHRESYIIKCRCIKRKKHPYIDMTKYVIKSNVHVYTIEVLANLPITTPSELRPFIGGNFKVVKQRDHCGLLFSLA